LFESEMLIMVKLAVYNKDGKEIETLDVNEAVLGGSVRYALLKQAIVMYQSNKRLGTATTKGRSMVAGSSKKLYRQKGTGYARVGNRRTGKRVGGGMTFAKTARDFSKRMPNKQKQLARDSAVLAKLLSNNLVVIDKLDFKEPKTKDFADVLRNLKIERSCLVGVKEHDKNLYLSARNVSRINVMPVDDLNAGDICNHQKMLFTKDAIVSFLDRSPEDEN
jgi:large subunit ribosomal protein L4